MNNQRRTTQLSSVIIQHVNANPVALELCLKKIEEKATINSKAAKSSQQINLT